MPLVLFDLDDTLVDHQAAFHAWAEEFAVQHALGGEAVDWLLMAKEHYCGPKDGLFRMICEEFSLVEPAEWLWEQYRRRIPQLVTCRPQDLRALRRLRGMGWRVGIVTNGMADNQLGKIHRTGLAAVVDGWCVSGEVGIRKPDPRIFHLAAQRCGTVADRTGWMVGDSLVLDVTGGRAAGLQTIWINPTGSTPPSEQPDPDLTVSTVAEAAERLVHNA
jgi:FMN phosphatase YigB (HAD superfamily)